MLPNHLHKAELYERTIYVYEKKSIADSKEFDVKYSTYELVNLGYENLKTEYSSLD